MDAQSDPRELARTVVIADYRPATEDIEVVMEKHSGKDAALAVAFEDRDGIPRRGIIGICRHHSNVWEPSGAFMGSARVVNERDVWMTWGGWGPADGAEHAIFGGWVANPNAVSARAIDSKGRTLQENVENGVALFVHTGPFLLQQARLELLDADGVVLRAGSMRHQR